MAKHFWITFGVMALFLLNTVAVRADDPPGAKLYATYCGACHGAAGKGGFAPAIGSSEFLAGKDDAAIVQITAEGRLSNGMPAWSKSKGGTLTDDQINDIVAYLRSLAPSTSTNAPAPTAATAPPALHVFIQTKMTLTQSTNAEGEPVLHVSLKEYTGYPVGGVSIAFSRPTMFGDVDLGTAKTDAAGNATFIVDGLPAEARQVVASFKGDKDWDATDGKIGVDLPLIASTPNGDLRSVNLSVDEPLLAPEGSLITPNPPLLPTTLFVLVVGCVWAIYGYVVYQIYGILRIGMTKPPSRLNRLR